MTQTLKTTWAGGAKALCVQLNAAIGDFRQDAVALKLFDGSTDVREHKGAVQAACSVCCKRAGSGSATAPMCTACVCRWVKTPLPS